MKPVDGMEPTWAESTWADDGGSTPSPSSGAPSAPRGDDRRGVERFLSHYPGPLERLYARHMLIATGREMGDSRLLHLAILDRLAANRRIAEEQGWTSLALQRIAGMGQLELWGVAAAGERREIVPDWAPR